MKNLWEDYFTCENYFQIRKSMFKEEEIFLDYILKGVKENGKILDLCCGAGLHAQYFSSKGKKVTAMDGSKVMIQFASKNINSNINLIYGDIRNLNIFSEFDLVTFIYGSFVFTDTKEAKTILNNVAKHLKKGGKLVIDNRNFSIMYDLIGTNNWIEREGHRELQEFSIDSMSNIITTKTHYLFKDKNREDYSVGLVARYYTLAELVEMFNEAGFIIEEVFGSYSLEPYWYKSSPRIIITARKGA
ncbi:MAG: methyltransferase domain-containing protein [Halanaerobiales bacterium]|nr:methyltransferase domain-containing protein [Halanaerobiales bacterium]